MNIKLTDEQISTLLALLETANEAYSDLNNSLRTGYMSNSKESIRSLANSSLRAGLPDEISAKLKEHAELCWSSVSGNEDAYRRAGRTIFNIGELKQYIKLVLQKNSDATTRIKGVRAL